MDYILPCRRSSQRISVNGRLILPIYLPSSNRVKHLKQIFLLLLLGFRLQPLQAGSCLIRGEIPPDSAWSPVIYVCELASLSQWYLASDHLIIGEIPIDPQGHFSALIPVRSKRTEFLRLQMVRQDDPPSTLYVGNKLENYLVIPVRDGDTIDLHADRMPWKLSRVDAPVFPSFDRIKQYFDHLTIQDTSGKQISDQLITWWANGQDPAVGWYAAYRFQNLFPGQQEQIIQWAGRLPRHPYAFLPARPVWWHYALPGLFIFLLLAGSFWWWTTRRHDPQADQHRKLSSLTTQELRILKGIIAGKTNKELAAELFIEISTIKTHINRMYQKLEIKSRKEARQYAESLPMAIQPG